MNGSTCRRIYQVLLHLQNITIPTIKEFIMSSNYAQKPAQGEKSLSKLLCTLRATLNPETFVFLTFLRGTPPPTSLDIQMAFREAEGQTIITTQSSAISHSFEYMFPSRMITLDVHSSLEAVGFIAAVSARLTEANIGVNPVSGYFHDHLFVSVGREEDALRILGKMTEEAKAS